MGIIRRIIFKAGSMAAIAFLFCIMTACENEIHRSEISIQTEPYETVAEVTSEPKTLSPTVEIATEPLPNDISRIDFHFFEDKMDSHTWNALLVYIPILQGKAEFTLSMEAFDHEISSYEKIKGKDRMDLHEFFLLNGETENSITINQFSVFDIDNDGTQELIVCFDNLSGQYLVFHEENGTFYAASLVHRGLQCLFPTGIILASGGAGCIHWRTLSFEDGSFIGSELASTDWNNDKQHQEFKIEGELVDEDTYAAWEQAHFLQFSVPWYQPLENGKWCRRTYNYSEWGTDLEELL